MMRTSRPVRLRSLLALFALVVTASPAAAQTTYTWNSGTANTNWLDPGNWTGGPAGTWPGTAPTDVARFQSFDQGSSNGVAINFGTIGGTLSLGAINFAPTGGSGSQIIIGNSSTTTPGVLRLNGATVGGVPNVLIGETTDRGEAYYFQNSPQGSGGPGMTIQLGIPNGVILSSEALLFFRVPISEAAPGYGITIRDALVQFTEVNTFSGATRIEGGWLSINRDAALGTAPSSPTPNHIVIQPNAGFPGTLSTNAATFEIHANRGIAIGPTSGSGDAVIEVPDPTVPGYTPTITYNGVITNNGAGSGRLVMFGGGKLVLGGNNTFTGGTLHNGGEILLTNVNALGTTGTVTITPFGTNDFGERYPGILLVQAAGNFGRPIVVDYTGLVRQVTIGTPDFAAGGATEFSDNITLNSRPVTLQGGNSVETRFTGVIGGTGNVTVTATAAGRRVVFTGNNTYAGTTTVASGTLLVNNAAGSGTGTGAVTVNSGGTLGGTGQVAGQATVNSGGTLRAGDATASGTLTLNNGLTMQGGSNLAVRINAVGTPGAAAGSGGSSDSLSNPTNHNYLLVTAGVSTIDAGMNIVVDGTGLTFDPSQTYSYKVAQLTGNQSGVNITNPSRFTFVGFPVRPASLTGDSTGAIYLNLAPVPEPATVLGIAAAGLGLAGLVRRKRNRGRWGRPR
jgi:autotransporter-associated beta strand protein